MISSVYIMDTKLRLVADQLNGSLSLSREHGPNIRCVPERRNAGLWRYYGITALSSGHYPVALGLACIGDFYELVVPSMGETSGFFAGAVKFLLGAI